MSSSAVFGAPDRNPVDESTPPRPQEDYGRAKLQAEELCLVEAARDLDVTIIRPRTILGHGRLGIMQVLFEWVRRGRNVPVFDGGDNVYQFVHASDLADACLLAAERPGPRVYNIGAKRFGPMKETLAGLVLYANTGSAVVSVPSAPVQAMMKVTSQLGLSPLGPYHALMYGRSMYFDTTRAETELGWSARYGNVEMICESYDWYLEHRTEVLGRTGRFPSPVTRSPGRAARRIGRADVRKSRLGSRLLLGSARVENEDPHRHADVQRGRQPQSIRRRRARGRPRRRPDDRRRRLPGWHRRHRRRHRRERRARPT
jgi:hypothetical protein